MAKILCEVRYNNYNTATNSTCFRDLFTQKPSCFWVTSPLTIPTPVGYNQGKRSTPKGARPSELRNISSKSSDWRDTLLNAVLNKISNYVDTEHNASVKQDGDWSNIGVVVKSNNEQSYIGISIRIKGKK